MAHDYETIHSEYRCAYMLSTLLSVRCKLPGAGAVLAELPFIKAAHPTTDFVISARRIPRNWMPPVRDIILMALRIRRPLGLRSCGEGFMGGQNRNGRAKSKVDYGL